MSTQPAQDRPKRTRRRTGSYAAADGRRAAILDAALARFAQSGYLKASIAQIAADAGTSPAGLLHHFGSKERLLKAVLEARDQRAATDFFAQDPAGLPDAEFDAVAELARHISVAEFNLTQPGLMEMYAKLSAEATDPDHPAHEFFVQRYAHLRGRLTGLLERGARLGQLAPDRDWPALSREILAVWDGLQLQWSLAPDSFDLPAALRGYLDRLVRTLTPDGRGLPQG